MPNNKHTRKYCFLVAVVIGFSFRFIWCVCVTCFLVPQHWMVLPGELDRKLKGFCLQYYYCLAPGGRTTVVATVGYFLLSLRAFLYEHHSVLLSRLDSSPGKQTVHHSSSTVLLFWRSRLPGWATYSSSFLCCPLKGKRKQITSRRGMDGTYFFSAVKCKIVVSLVTKLWLAVTANILRSYMDGFCCVTFWCNQAFKKAINLRQTMVGF